jgi:thioester reductase-like protein
LNSTSELLGTEPLLSAATARFRSELHAFARQHLPEAMIPTRFVVLDQLPKLPNGKVDRKRLPVNEVAKSFKISSRPPTTPEEVRLARIWCEILGLPWVGVEDSFFDLGGDSLASAQMAARVKDAFGVSISLRRLFDHPTIQGLSKLLGARGEGAIERNGNSRSLSSEALFKEATLPADITPDAGALPAFCGPYRRVLLTGATGYTGAYLLRELLDRSEAQIYVLVRAESVADSLDRVRENMATYGLWRDGDMDHLIGAVGDLGLPYLGLNRATYEELVNQVEVIVHNGALSSYALPYKSLKAVNVLGTLEVLRLACRHRIKPVHFISSLAVFPGHDGPQEFAEVALTDPDGVVGGYRQTKWAADRLTTLAGERGLPVCIYRPGLISGAQDTGACSNDTFLNASMKGCIQLGMALDFEVCLEMVPVDFCAKVVAHVALSGRWHGTRFNLPAANTLHWTQLIGMLEECGYPLQRVPYGIWYRALANAVENAEANELTRFFPLFGEDRPSEDVGYPLSRPHFRTDNLSAALSDSCISCRPIDKDFLQVYLNYFVATGFLPPPRKTTQDDQ